MPKRILLIILIFTATISNLTKAQDSIAKPDTSQLNKKILIKTIAFESEYYLGAMLVLQNTWYKDRKVVPFHFYNDSRDYLQVDKCGHAFAAYVESYIGYQCLVNAVVSKTNALIYGGTLGLVLQTPIEIMDGIH